METALRIASSDNVRKTRVRVLAVDESGQIKVLPGALPLTPPHTLCLSNRTLIKYGVSVKSL